MGGDGGGERSSAPAQDPPYLWYAGGGLNAFTAAQAAQSGDGGARFHLAPHLALQNFHDLAFDGQGNLWAVPFPGDEIIRFPAAELPPASNEPSPDLVLTSAALHSAQNLAFDAAGDLWVVSYDGAGQSIASISRFDHPSALQGNVMLDPSINVLPGASVVEQQRFTQPSAIAFDVAGNLWLATAADVLRFDHPQDRSGTVALYPTAIISGGDAYAALAFDATGALWLTGAGGGYFVERIDHPEALAGAMTPTPDVRLLLPAQGGVRFAGGMAFDDDGALWVAMSNRLVRVSGARLLTGSHEAMPDVVLGTTSAPDLSSKLVLR